MLPLTLVHATTAAKRAQIMDDRDDRESTFFTRELVADFDPTAERRAYAVPRRVSLCIRVRGTHHVSRNEFWSRQLQRAANQVRGQRNCLAKAFESAATAARCSPHAPGTIQSTRLVAG